MAITKENIFQVANDIEELGQKATLAEVRKRLGGGSFTTISEAMKEWRDLKTTNTTVIKEKVAQSVLDKLSELGDELWGAALEIANNRLISEREALEGVRVEIEETKQEAVELADQLVVDLDNSHKKLNSLENQLQETKKENDDLKVKLAAGLDRAAKAEIKSNEIELRTNVLRKELDYAHKSSLNDRKDLKEALQNASNAQEIGIELNGVKNQLQKIKKEDDDLKVKLAAGLEREVLAEKKYNKIELNFDELKKELNNAQRASLNDKKDLKEALQKTRKAQEIAATFKGRIEGLETALSLKKKDIKK